MGSPTGRGMIPFPPLPAVVLLPFVAAGRAGRRPDLRGHRHRRPRRRGRLLAAGPARHPPAGPERADGLRRRWGGAVVRRLARLHLVLRPRRRRGPHARRRRPRAGRGGPRGGPRPGPPRVRSSSPARSPPGSFSGWPRRAA